MTILKQPLKCHWLVNDKFWGSPLWSWSMVKAENHCLIILIMDIRLMAKCHWPQSMTKIYGQNFKKIVIDHGQWQKNCHLLKVIYPLCSSCQPRDLLIKIWHEGVAESPKSSLFAWLGDPGKVGKVGVGRDANNLNNFPGSNLCVL